MPQKPKLPVEEKARIVRDCIAGGTSESAASKAAGVDKTTIKSRIKRYEAEGEEGLKVNERNRRYTAEGRTAAVEEYLRGGGSLYDICQKHRIRSRRQLQNRIKVYNAHGDFNSVKQSGSRVAPFKQFESNWRNAA